MNTRINYLYRDADNYKMPQCCILSGGLTYEKEKEILNCLESGEYFIPRQVGLPEKRFDRYDPAVDHCWFEWDGFCLTEAPSTIALSVEELLNNFRAAKGNWDDSYDNNSDESDPCIDTKEAELQFILQYAKTTEGVTDTIGLAQIHALWIAYCLHHDIEVDTNEYDNAIQRIWSTLNDGVKTTVA